MTVAAVQLGLAQIVAFLISRKHEHFEARIFRFEALEQLDAAHAGHVDIRENQHELRGVVLRQICQRFLAGKSEMKDDLADFDLAAEVLQKKRLHVDVDFIINYHDFHYEAS